jgi:diguanylate cyclase (GGDEF)-like protein/PAS domain S-box-containing protein
LKVISYLPRPSKAAFRKTLPSLVFASLIALVVVLVGLTLDRQNNDAYRRELQIRTENEANLIRSRVFSQVSNDVTVVRDLANVISILPDIRSEDVEQQINTILIQNPQIISIAIAPNFIVGSVFPYIGKDTRLGHDLREQMPSDPPGLHDKENIRARFYGPVVTESGTSAFAMVFPVFIRDGAQRKLWGGVEATFDAEQLYESTGLKPTLNSENEEKYPHFDHLSIAVRDPASIAGLAMEPFLGSKDVVLTDSVHRNIRFPGGKWELSVIPKAGWETAPANQTALRLIIVIAGCVIVVPIFFSTLLLAERTGNIVTLEGREAALLEVSSRLNLALETSNIGIWELHDDGNLVYWDAKATSLHGPGLGPEGERRLEDWYSAVHSEDREIVRSHVTAANSTGTPHHVQYRVLAEDGAVRTLRSVGAFYDSNGRHKTIGIVWDVTEDVLLADTLRHAKSMGDIKNAELELALDELSVREQELEGLSQKLNLALDSYQCGTWELVIGNEKVSWDRRMHQLFGLSYVSGMVSDEEWLSCLHPEDQVDTYAFVKALKKAGDSGSAIRRILLPDGSVRFVRSVGKLHETKDGVMKIVGVAFDVTEDAILTAEIKAAKDEAIFKNVELELVKSRIEHNSLHDPLTALANRRKLDVALESLTLDSSVEPQTFAILHIDLDRFKEINDTLGHAAGDAMLVHVSKVLARNISDNDIVARIGGDEFVILAINTDDPQALSALANKIIEEARQPIDFQGFTCRCGVSIGIAQASGYDVDARTVLINADIALYRAKSLGRNRHEFFSQHLQAEVINGKHMADAILAGLENGEFTAWYQPQFCAQTMELTGVEALVRWNHPTRGVLAPDQFLRIADEINVVQMLDRIVLETALKDKMRWTARGITVPKISVNVSSRRLHDSNLIDSLAGLQIAPGELSFELVESIFLDESEDIVSENIDRIKALGIDIEIDDFGTGHTSIVSLLKLKPKRLKIDRQLVMPILTSPQERALVSSIIEIARSLGVETVAEGVETMEHAVRLRELGCDLLQGYAFARPLSFEAFAEVAGDMAWRLAS